MVKKLSKRLVVFSILLSGILFLAVMIYSTYATGESQQNDTYAFDLTGNASVTVPRYSYKDIIYQVKNTNPGTVRYGVGYSSTNGTATVKVFTDSTDLATGTVAANGYKYIKMRIENYSENSDTVTFSTILGYENGGNLIVPSGTTSVTATTDGNYTMNPATNSTYFYISDLTRANIESIEYKKLSDMPVNQTTTNISSDNSVRLWYELDVDTNLYKVYVGSLTGKFKASADMSSMFRGLTNVTSLNLSSIDTSAATIMSTMFYGSTGLTSLELGNFVTSNVSNMQGMFMNCSNLSDLDLGSFNTRSVTTMRGMFYGCSSLTSLDLSNFYTDSLTTINNGGAEGMFGACTALEELDLRNFDTSSVTDMRVVFYNCRSLRILRLDNWDFSNVVNYTYAFSIVPSSVDITVRNCIQYNNFRTKFGTSFTNLHTVDGDYSCTA